MKESEVIIVDGLSAMVFEQCFTKALNYAILSLPYTYNRMDFKSIEKRISNIVKGKLSEGLFEHFCIANQLGFDFFTCQTPFYHYDKRDYIFGHTEWDLKNNYLNHIGEYWFGKYIQLPALIPDHSNYSQWKNRSKIKNEYMMHSAFVFSFMKLSSKYKGSFFEVNFSKEQLKFLIEKYQNALKSKKVYDPVKLLNNLGSVDFSIRKHPYLVITAYASQSEWQIFQKETNSAMNFCKGVLRTKIRNKYCEIAKLPSFYQRFFSNDRPLKLAKLKS